MDYKYKNILVPVDLAHESSWRQSVPIAIEQTLQHGATLHFVTVVPYSDIPAIAAHLPKGVDKRILDAGKEALKELAHSLFPELPSVSLHVGQGRVYKEVLRIAEQVEADLIVMASHRPELSDYLIGANAANVTRHAQCSVLVVREP